MTATWVPGNARALPSPSPTRGYYAPAFLLDSVRACPVRFSV